MIRLHTGDGWRLLTHPDHARLAGFFAEHWGGEFVRPEPFSSVRAAVAHHDDAWADRDAEPELTPEGQPSAFSADLVGTYDAFEEIDLPAYLRVRGNATEVMAERDPVAAILISMHTVNLLTEQADLSALSEESRELHAAFVAGQRERQRELRAKAIAAGTNEATISEAALEEGFRFLQGCDSLSLTVCVRYPEPIPLRHTHITTAGEAKTITCTPQGNDTYLLDPWPFAEQALTCALPYRWVPADACRRLTAFREAYATAPTEELSIRLSPPV